jgi:hypothetical protein
MIFMSRSRVGLGVGLLVAGLLLIDAGNGRLIPVLAGSHGSGRNLDREPEQASIHDGQA